MKLLILDIDDTLFDWLGMWEGAFLAAVEMMRSASSSEEGELLARLRTLHVAAGTSERGYDKSDSRHLSVSASAAQKAGEVYEQESARRTIPFPEVVDTLTDLRARGVMLALHTSSPGALAHHRGVALGLDGLVDRIYATETRSPTIHRRTEQRCNVSRVQVLADAKPSTAALQRILEDLEVSPADTVYLGDSKGHDIPMARAVGVLDVHAEYGCRRESSAYELLRRVSHWTDEEIALEKTLQKSDATHAIPTFSAIASFF